MRSDLVTRGAPQTVIVIGIYRLFTFTVRNRKPATCGDRLQVLTKIDNLTHHRPADLLKMRIIHARANVHMNADQLQVITLQHVKRGWHIGIPDTVFAVFAAGVGFLAMTMTKTRVHA